MPAADDKRAHDKQAPRSSFRRNTLCLFALTIALAFFSGFAFGLGEQVRRGVDWHGNRRLDQQFAQWQHERKALLARIESDKKIEAAYKRVDNASAPDMLRSSDDDAAAAAPWRFTQELLPPPTDEALADAITIYVVTGPESSGHHALVNALLAACDGHCSGRATNTQPLDRSRDDAEWVNRLNVDAAISAPKTHQRPRCWIVFRSVPHADQWPALSAIAHHAIRDASELGEHIRMRFLVLLRPDPLVAISQLERGHTRTLTQAAEHIERAHATLARELAVLTRQRDAWIRYVHYDHLGRPAYLHWLLSECGWDTSRAVAAARLFNDTQNRQRWMQYAMASMPN